MNRPALTLIPLGAAADNPEAVLEPIRAAWPPHAAVSLTAESHTRFELAKHADELADVVLIALAANDDAPAAAKLIDALDDLSRTIAVTGPADVVARAARPGDGVVTLTTEAGPDASAAALHALLQRRLGLNAFLGEHDAMRRSHLGLQREMQHIREELQLASRVQREFMPKTLPQTPGLEVATLFRPCGYVSGDIYDIVRLDEHHVGFFIADAVGHGVPAALMTMVLSHGMCMKEIKGNQYRIIPPGEVLQRCNDALIAGNMPADRFLTAAYGLVDTRTLEVQLAGAGHPPPVLVSKNGSRTIDTDGPLLGVFPGADFDETSFTIRPEETLLIYSDGFETAFPDDPAASETDFARRLPTTRYLDHFQDISAARDKPGGLSGAFARLADAVDAQSGSLHQVDDITALAIARATADADLASAA